MSSVKWQPSCLGLNMLIKQLINESSIVQVDLSGYQVTRRNHTSRRYHSTIFTKLFRFEGF